MRRIGSCRFTKTRTKKFCIPLIKHGENADDTDDGYQMGNSHLLSPSLFIHTTNTREPEWLKKNTMTPAHTHRLWRNHLPRRADCLLPFVPQNDSNGLSISALMPFVSRPISCARGVHGHDTHPPASKAPSNAGSECGLPHFLNPAPDSDTKIKFKKKQMRLVSNIPVLTASCEVKLDTLLGYIPQKNKITSEHIRIYWSGEEVPWLWLRAHIWKSHNRLGVIIYASEAQNQPTNSGCLGDLPVLSSLGRREICSLKILCINPLQASRSCSIRERTLLTGSEFTVEPPLVS